MNNTAAKSMGPGKTTSSPGPFSEAIMKPMRQESLFTIRGTVPEYARGVLMYGALTTFLIAWFLLSAFHVINPFFIPGPFAILNAIVELIRDHGLLSAIWVSSLRILLATVISIAVAFPLGVLMGTFDAVNRALEPILNPLRYMPATAFIPLLILWFGIDESQKISFLFLGTFVFLYPVVIDAIRAVPEDLVSTARTLGASRWQVITTVLIPASLPQIADSFRNLNAIAWGYVILAEIVNARQGIGHMLNVASQHARTEWTIAGILIIGVIGFISDQIILRLTHRVFRWRENA